ncbi:unnamed protein product [Darwinula stevensoni]|uniref:Uncharacterized protein n=1 Tax=Darwinula stevensoni TaxID=69355 RepID=A0A7R8XAH1_9CRUS|nr:unnamed protein product [Darwinula stevensoni]CAG0885569.1 unnamed protein product [Darwinula stevensoni]
MCGESIERWQVPDRTYVASPFKGFLTDVEEQEKHALVSVKIFSRLLLHPVSHNHILAVFTENDQMRRSVMHAFLACLEVDTRDAIQGIMGCAKSCLHGVLGILDQLTSPTVDLPLPQPRALQHSPGICSLAYQVIYKAVSSPEISEPVLRYLRTSRDLLFRHLALLPFQVGPLVERLQAMAWLMKAVAVELKVGASVGQRSYLLRLSSLLIGGTNHDGESNMLSSSSFSSSSSHHVSSFHQHTGLPGTLLDGTGLDARLRQSRKLFSLLDYVDLTGKEVEAPTLELFEKERVKELLSKCTEACSVASLPVGLIHVERLHSILQRELDLLFSSGAVLHKQPFISELQAILSYAIKVNGSLEVMGSNHLFLDGWRQVTCTYFSVVDPEPHNFRTRHHLLREVSQELLSKMLHEEVVGDLKKVASGVILLLVTHLRHCFLMNAEKSSTHLLQSQAPLQTLFHKLLVTILKTRKSEQRVRLHLYGALVNFLRMGDTGQGKEREKLQFLISEREQDRFCTLALEGISSYGEAFMNVLVNDSFHGPDIVKLEAMTCLTLICSMDRRGAWLSFLSSRTHLRHLIDAVTSRDSQLLQEIASPSSPLRAIEMYKARMLLVMCLSRNKKGAQLILQAGFLARLTLLDFPLPAPADSHDAGDLILGILRSPFKEHPEALRKVALCTHLLASVAQLDVPEKREKLEYQMRETRFLKALLSLISKMTSERNLRDVQAMEKTSRNLLFQVQGNILQHLVTVTGHWKPDKAARMILFDPSLLDEVTVDIPGYRGESDLLGLPPLGVLLRGLKTYARLFLSMHEDLVNMRKKKDAFSTLSSDQLQQFQLVEEKGEMGPGELKEEAWRKLVWVEEGIERDKMLVAFLLESSLYLLWQHLEYFLVHWAPTARPALFPPAREQEKAKGDIGIHGSELKQEKYEKLKADLPSCISDSLFLLLQQVQQILGRSTSTGPTALEILTRRIKRLVQYCN